jgi:putative lipoic acid-binding regulatory protein
MNDNETLLQFPCKFPIKAMGLNSHDFDTRVVEIVGRHSPDIPEGAVNSRVSQSAKYMSVTVTITAQSKAQLDAIYQDLTEAKEVVMAL